MSIDSFLVVAAIVLVVGLIVAWHDRKTRAHDRHGDAASARHRYAYREFEGRSSAQAMNAGATVVHRDAAGADAIGVRADGGRDADDGTAA